jgi:hypothetical protein
MRRLVVVPEALASKHISGTGRRSML